MCGRFGLGNPERLDGFLYRFNFPGIAGVAPRFNITPSADIPIVLTMERDVITTPASWGLVPEWASDKGMGARLVQARAETAHQKPAFRRAVASRRALLPADLFYEWQPVAGHKLQQPWCIRRNDEEVFAMGGLWELWQSPGAAPGETLLSCCVLTTASNTALGHIHERMPLIIEPDAYNTWLDPSTNAESVRELLRPYGRNDLNAYRISTWVNSPAHDDARCLEPLTEPAHWIENDTLPAAANLRKGKRNDSEQIDAFG